MNWTHHLNSEFPHLLASGLERTRNGVRIFVNQPIMCLNDFPRSMKKYSWLEVGTHLVSVLFLLWKSQRGFKIRPVDSRHQLPDVSIGTNSTITVDEETIYGASGTLVKQLCKLCPSRALVVLTPFQMLAPPLDCRHHFPSSNLSSIWYWSQACRWLVVFANSMQKWCTQLLNATAWFWKVSQRPTNGPVEEDPLLFFSVVGGHKRPFYATKV